MVRYYAGRIMQDYADERGWNRFRSDVLNRMARGEIGVPWLQREFVRLAEVYPGFTYGAWNDLCTDGRGRLFTAELLFQMRLLWTEWLGKDAIAQVGVRCFGDTERLPEEIVVHL